MPHLNRSITGTSGIRPEVLAALPYEPRRAAPRLSAPPEKAAGPGTPLLPTLSIAKFDVPAEKIFQYFYGGKKPDVHEYTRELRRAK